MEKYRSKIKAKFCSPQNWKLSEQLIRIIYKKIIYTSKKSQSKNPIILIKL